MTIPDTSSEGISPLVDDSESTSPSSNGNSIKDFALEALVSVETVRRWLLGSEIAEDEIGKPTFTIIGDTRRQLLERAVHHHAIEVLGVSREELGSWFIRHNADLSAMSPEECIAYGNSDIFFSHVARQQ